MPGNEILNQDPVLPVLRPELELQSGPPAKDGSPTFVLHDPVTRLWRKAGWAEGEIIKRLQKPTTLRALLVDIHTATTLRVTAEEVMLLCRRLQIDNLCTGPANPPQTTKGKNQEENPIMRILSYAVYFRVPLVNPDVFLARTVKYVRVLAGRQAFMIYGAIWLAGLYFLLQNFERYFATFPHFFSLQGVFAYGLTIAVVKVMHEFAHAYTAKALGVRVPLMGVAFIVFWPLAFCDVTDGWRLASRRKRLCISCAGVIAELVIAGFGFLLWGLTGPGILHSMAFLVSSGTIISSLLVNVNPAMRFDGYYILADLWGMDNLRPRAFAMTRYLAYRNLLGMDIPAPETLSTGNRIGMLVYTIYAVLYRISLYTAIAVTVYFKFTKILGILLFLNEICWFVLRPIAHELAGVYSRRAAIRPNLRLGATLLVLGLALAWIILPMQRSISVTALVEPVDSQVVYVPLAGEVEKITAKPYQTVKPGNVLAIVKDPELSARIRLLELQNQRLLQQLLLLSLDPARCNQIAVNHKQRKQVQARLRALRETLNSGTISARLGGVIAQWDTSVKPGQAIARGTVLGRIMTGKLRVTGFLEEDFVQSVKPGSRIKFFAAGAETPLSGRLRRTREFREHSLENMFLQSVKYSDLPLRRGPQGRMELVGSYYAVDVELDPSDIKMRPGSTGRLWLITQPRSRLADLGRAIWRTLMRESDF